MMITDDNKELDVDAQALKLENRKKRIALLMNEIGRAHV